MNWFRMGIALTVPAALAVLVALPFWLKSHAAIGNVIGAGVLLVAIIAAGGIEYVDAERLCEAYISVNKPCPTSATTFMKMAPYGIVGFVQIAGLFWISLMVEERMARRGFDRSWR